MDSNKVDMFLMTNAKHFEQMHIPQIREQLLNADESVVANLMTTQFKDPTTILIVSILAGGLGIDRFMIGDTGMGVGKLLTCGGFFIWQVVDWFLIMPATREKNMQKFKNALGYGGYTATKNTDDMV